MFLVKKNLIILVSIFISTQCFPQVVELLEEDHGFAIVTAIRNKMTGQDNSLKISSRRPLKVKGKKKYIRKIEIPPKETFEFDDIKVLGSGLKVEGYYSQEIPSFPKGSMLELNPLKGKGFAWLSKSLEISDRSSVYTRVKVGDKGGATIVFSNKISPKFDYEIIIGANNNTESQIIKGDRKTKRKKVIYRVTREENALAATRPGRFEEYWVSLNNGMILVGKGSLGENTFMSIYDPDAPKNINRAGFGSTNTKTEFVDIQTGLPLVPQTKWRPYFEKKGVVKLGKANGRYKVSPNPLRVPGRGCFSFEAKGTALSVALGDKLEYELLIGIDENSRTVLRRNGKEVASILADACKDIVIASPDKFYRYWISIDNGQIMFGRGSVGTNLLLSWKDADPIKISNTLNLGSIAASGEFKIEGTIEFKNIEIGPSISMTIDIQKEYYKKQKDLFMYPDSFVVVSPLEYEVFQSGQQVGVKDLIIGPTYYIQKVPQQGAKYFFMFVINKDGSPDLVWIKGPEESKLKVAMEKAAYIAGATTEATAGAAGATSMGAGAGKGGLIAGIAGVGFAAASIGLRTATAGMEFEKSRYRSDDSYVFMEAGNKEAMAGMRIPGKAKENRQAIMMRIQEALFEEDPKILAIMYQDIIDLINHFYVVEDPEGAKTSYAKKKIFSAIEKLYNLRYKVQNIEFYLALLKLLIDARDNPYLTDVNNSKEKILKDQWYIWSNEIAQELFKARNNTLAGVSLPPSYGEYFWMTDKFTKSGYGSVTFEAKGLNDIFVCLGQRPFKTRNTTNQIYEIVIGAWDNEKTVIRVASLGKTVEEYLAEDFPNSVADPLEFKKYWVSLKDGEISMGTGEMKPKNILLKWKDAYPIPRIRYVGFSSWNAKVDIRNVQVHNYSVEDAAKMKKSLKIKTKKIKIKKTKVKKD